MSSDRIAEFCRWRVVGMTCDMPEPEQGATIELRLSRADTGEIRSLLFKNATPESVFEQFPIFNASLQVCDTTGRGWESERRYEVTDTDDDGPYFYAGSFDVAQNEET